MAIRTLNAEKAAALDKELMSTGAYSIDQLMELAGLAVSQAVYKMHPPSSGKRVLVACGPGNNGGDGLVAARHVKLYGYEPTVYYPKPGKIELYQRLITQIRDLSIPIITEFPKDLNTKTTDLVIDAIFGFSFTGAVREPFPAVITALAETKIPILAVDAPSSWNIETGPPADGPGISYSPTALISLTAPKPLVRWFRGRHFVGGRFLGPEVAQRFEIDVPPYEGSEQVCEVPTGADGEKL